MVGDGGWSWFGDPRAVYFSGRHRRTYVGWVSREGNLMVASFDHRSRHIERFVLRYGLSVDDHNSPGLLMRENGRLTVFYMGPGRGHMYYRRSSTRKTSRAGAPSVRCPRTRPATSGTRIPTRCTSAREAHVPVLARGAVVAGVLAPRRDQQLDARAHAPAHPRPAAVLQVPQRRRAKHPHRLHRGKPRQLRQQRLLPALSSDAFYRADGTRVAGIRSLPLAPREGDRVYDSRPSGVRAWVWDVAARG